MRSLKGIKEKLPINKESSLVAEGGLFHDPHLVCSPSQNPCPAAQGFGLFAFIPHSSRLGSG